jgi:hypothetical protein
MWVAEIGLGLTGFGCFFFFMGVLLLLDRSLLAMGNVRVQYSHFLVLPLTLFRFSL